MSVSNNGVQELSSNDHPLPQGKPLLDLISIDMDFEQAYSMYSTIQQQNALQSVEQLEKAQLQRGLLDANQAALQHTIPLAADEQCIDVPAPAYAIQSNAFNDSCSLRELPAPFPNHEYANAREMLDLGFDRFQIASGPRRDSIKESQVIDQFFSNTELDALERFLDTLANPISTQRNTLNHDALKQWASHECLSMPHDLYTNKGPGPLQELEYVNSLMRTFDDVTSDVSKLRNSLKDQSQLTLEKYPSQPMDSPNSGDKRSHDLTISQDSHMSQINCASQDMTRVSSSMKPLSEHNSASQFASSSLGEFSPVRYQSLGVKDARQPFTQLLTSHGGAMDHRWNSTRMADEGMLLLISPPLSDTPLAPLVDILHDHGQTCGPSEKRVQSSNLPAVKFGKDLSRATKPVDLRIIDVAAGRPGRRRRLATKPLLSVEQKRLNHSFSEQKRRLMCKMAYDRCLRLVIDIGLFQKIANQLARSAPHKRKDLVGYNHPAMDKDGMPKLSKHNALMRISNEIMLLKHMNESLMKILYGPGTTEEIPIGVSKEQNLAAT